MFSSCFQEKMSLIVIKSFVVIDCEPYSFSDYE